MTDLESLSDTITAGLSSIAAARENAALQSAKLAQIDTDSAASNHELDRLAEIAGKEMVDQILSDEAAPLAPKPKRTARIQNLKDRVAALKLARPVQLERCNEAKTAEQHAREQLADSVLPAIAKLRLSVAANCPAPLSAAVRALVETAALDVVQDHLVGTSFTLRGDLPSEGLFRMTPALIALKKALSPRLQEMLDADLQDIPAAISARANSTLIEIGAWSPTDAAKGAR